MGATERLKSLPGVPTTSEAGLPFDPAVWYGVFAPAATPPGILRLLSDELSRLVADNVYRRDMEAKGSQVPIVTPQQFKTLISNEVIKYREVIAKAKIEQE